MFKIGESGKIQGEEYLKPILIYSKPEKMPYLKDGECVICILDYHIRKDIIVCETLEDMVEIWNKYSLGWILGLSWYTGSYLGILTIQPEGEAPQFKIDKPIVEETVEFPIETNNRRLESESPIANGKPNREKLSKEVGPIISREEMLAYLYSNMPEDYNILGMEELDDNTLFKYCYLVRKYNDIPFSSLMALKENKKPFDKIEDHVNACAKNFITKPELFFMPIIHLECSNLTSRGYVLMNDKKTYYVNGKVTDERQYQLAFKRN